MVFAGGVQRLAHRFGVSLVRRRQAVVGVANREASPGAELAPAVAVPLLHLGGEAGRRRDPVAVRLKVVDRRAEVNVEAAQVQLRRGQRPLHRRRRLPAGQREAEFAVAQAGGRLDVRARVHARGDPQHHGLRGAALAREPVQRVQLVVVVDDDPPHAGVERLLELVDPLGVAVETDLLGRHPASQRGVELAAGDDVHAQPLLNEDARERGREPGLGRVQHAHAGQLRLEGASVAAAGLANRLFVVDVERRPEALREAAQIAAANRKAPVGVGLSRERENLGVGQGHTRSVGAGVE